MRARTTTAHVDQDAYNAIIATSKVIRRVALGLFAEEGITESQFLALTLLVENGPMLMRKMSDEMLVTPANVTGIMDRLEEKSFVRRTAGKEDRRATIIEITQEGKSLYERVAIKKGDMLQKALGTFTKDELTTLHSLLEKFQREMSRSIGEHVALFLMNNSSPPNEGMQVEPCRTHGAFTSESETWNTVESTSSSQLREFLVSGLSPSVGRQE